LRFFLFSYYIPFLSVIKYRKAPSDSICLDSDNTFRASDQRRIYSSKHGCWVVKIDTCIIPKASSLTKQKKSFLKVEPNWTYPLCCMPHNGKSNTHLRSCIGTEQISHLMPPASPDQHLQCRSELNGTHSGSVLQTI